MLRLYFKLNSSVSINTDSIELIFIVCAMMVYYEKTFNWNKKCVEWDSNHWPHASWVNGRLPLLLLCTPVDEQWVLLACKNTLWSSKTQLSFWASPVSIHAETAQLSTCQKCRWMDKQIDRQTDGQTTF